MTALTRSRPSVTPSPATFEHRTLPIALARTGLATAGLALLVLNTDDVLFSPTPKAPEGTFCSGATTASLWCLSQASGLPPAVPRTIAVIVLALVVIGYRPRWTAIPHWYVAFSLATAISVPNGGESAAQVITLILIPICLSDDRAWQWTPPSRPLRGHTRGLTYAAFLTLRAQASVIYLTAAISKLTVADWRDGSAMAVIVHHPLLGFPGTVTAWLESWSWWPFAATLMTWGTLVTEAGIALLLWGGRLARRLAFVLGAGLHLAITAFMGIAGFGLVMLSLLVLVALERRSTDVGSQEPHCPSSTGSSRPCLST
ncbi:hypothetical protein Afil01_42220 [Actinorhabdospora filicis]|uniref:HTTM-like domain-containing protein n=1 Tax=Actinorhabdospora filicis TaxID=1785913 RepID=A0A9W6WC55_9ACTN|nr:sporulation-delaying protein SdpB family protein [Actinorhabdospora filicis]GLZ79415.1 hypothetical protein Afil01_42220 [Actinorhabdospora filicis]